MAVVKIIGKSPPADQPAIPPQPTQVLDLVLKRCQVCGLPDARHDAEELHRIQKLHTRCLDQAIGNFEATSVRVQKLVRVLGTLLRVLHKQPRFHLDGYLDEKQEWQCHADCKTCELDAAMDDAQGAL